MTTPQERDGEQHRFTNGKRRIASESEVASRWGLNGGRLYCHLCNKNIEVGDGWRWVYMNSDPSPTFGNFEVCDACDGPDVKERWISANRLLNEFRKQRGADDWPTSVIAQLQIRLFQADQRAAEAIEGERRANEKLARAITLLDSYYQGVCCCDNRHACAFCKEVDEFMHPKANS